MEEMETNYFVMLHLIYKIQIKPTKKNMSFWISNSIWISLKHQRKNHEPNVATNNDWYRRYLHEMVLHLFSVWVWVCVDSFVIVDLCFSFILIFHDEECINRYCAYNYSWNCIYLIFYLFGKPVKIHEERYVFCANTYSHTQTERLQYFPVNANARTYQYTDIYTHTHTHNERKLKEHTQTKNENNTALASSYINRYVSGRAQHNTTQHMTTTIYIYMHTYSIKYTYNIHTYILCVVHTAISCINVEIDTNQFQRKLFTISFFFIHPFSLPRTHVQTHIHTHTYISFSRSLAQFQNRKRLNELLRNFIEKIIPQNIYYSSHLPRICIYCTYRPKTESLRIVHHVCVCVCVFESNITTASSFATL